MLANAAQYRSTTWMPLLDMNNGKPVIIDITGARFEFDSGDFAGQALIVPPKTCISASAKYTFHGEDINAFEFNLHKIGEYVPTSCRNLMSMHCRSKEQVRYRMSGSIGSDHHSLDLQIPIEMRLTKN